MTSFYANVQYLLLLIHSLAKYSPVQLLGVLVTKLSVVCLPVVLLLLQQYKLVTSEQALLIKVFLNNYSGKDFAKSVFGRFRILIFNLANQEE